MIALPMFTPRIALTVDRKGAPLPGYLRGTPCGVLLRGMQRICDDECPELRLRTTARVRPYTGYLRCTLPSAAA
ncbi:MAG: hypothetical protein FWH18_11810 [Marinilabiliaceae bacterium]|nr:hypothetical protein [Marinilabiliaceae bacterium]